MSATFDEDVHKFSRYCVHKDALTDAQTDGTMAALLNPLRNVLRRDKNDKPQTEAMN